MLPILALAAQIVPSVVKWAAGDKAGEVAEKVASIATSLTGDSSVDTAMAAIAANPELSLKFQQEYYEFEIGMEKELTKRHQADMASDSWLSKNIRPLCLLGITLAIMVGVWLPDEYVSADRFQALTDMGTWVYGYYFVGRSTEKSGGLPGLTGLFRRSK